MEWRDECRIAEAFDLICAKQNEHEDRIQAIEYFIARIVEKLRKGEEDEDTES